MIGLVWFKGKGMELETRQIGGGQFLCLRLGTERLWARRRLKLGAGALRRAGVRRAVFPADFAHGEIFAAEGIWPVETMALQRAAAEPYIRRRLEGADPRRTTVAVVVHRAEGEQRELVKTLAARYRYVLLEAEEGGEALAAELRRETGAALEVNPGLRRLERADALVCFVPRAVSGGNRVYVQLYRGGRGIPLGLPPETAGRFPEGTDPAAAAAALWQMGAGEAAAFIDQIRC